MSFRHFITKFHHLNFWMAACELRSLVQRCESSVFLQNLRSYHLGTPLAQLCCRQLCCRFVIFRHIFVIFRHFIAKFRHIHFCKPAYTLRSYVAVFSACAVMLPFFPACAVMLPFLLGYWILEISIFQNCNQIWN